MTKKYFILLFLLLSALQNVNANTGRWYNIDLIIYKMSDPGHYALERWPHSWNIPDVTDSVNLNSISQRYNKDFKKNSRQQALLNNVASGLKKSSRYQILTHKSWRQRGLDKNKAVNIAIYSGKKYSYSDASTNVNISNQLPNTLFNKIIDPNGIFIGSNVTQYSPLSNGQTASSIVRELSGTVKVVLSRYLHVYTDLLFFKPVNIKKRPKDSSLDTYQRRFTADSKNSEEYFLPDDEYNIEFSNNTAFTTLHGFNIKEHRRMRSKELHYIDHPLIGMIIKTEPIKP